MKVRTSIVLTVGDDVRGLATAAEQAVRLRWPMLAPVVAHVHIGSDGRVARLGAGDEEVLMELEGLATDAAPVENPFKKNYALLRGELRTAQGKLLREIAKDVRRSDKLSRLMNDHEWRDAGGVFIHVLGSSFGPLSSVFPLALLDLLTTDGGRIAKGARISASTLCFLPGLFESDAVATRQEIASVARSHAMLSELEAALHPARSDAFAPDARAWVLGSLDKRGGVSDFEAVIETATRFVMCQIDGTLETGEGWANDLTGVVGQRRTFLSSFGSASLGYPRASLRKLGLAMGRGKLQVHMAGASEPDANAISADVQEWIRTAGLDEVVRQLPRLVGSSGTAAPGRMEAGSAIETVPLPGMPPIRAAVLSAEDWAAEVARRTETELTWGRIVQRAGDRLFSMHRQGVWKELEDRLGKSQSGIAHCRAFCEHLVGSGRGLTDALVGAEVSNLESMARTAQDYLAREAGLKGEPGRLHTLKVLMIPGKQEAIESAENKVASDRARLAKLEALLEENQGDSADRERIRDVQKRIQASESDLEKYRAELAELRDECDEQERLVADQRRLACDPARCHQFLDELRKKNAKNRREDEERLGMALEKRDDAERKYHELESRFRQKWLRKLRLLPFRDMVVDCAIALGMPCRLRRAASQRLDKACGEVAAKAKTHWDREVRDLARRFSFLVHAEANRVLDRLRDDVMEEGIRLAQLQARIREHGSSVETMVAEAKAELRQEGNAQGAAALSWERAERLMVDHKALARQVDAVVKSTSLSGLVLAVRENGVAAGFQSVADKAEDAIGEVVDEALDAEGLEVFIERAVADGEDGDIAKRWRGVQYAARAQVALKPEGPKRTERRVFFVPDGSSDTVKHFLEGALEEDEEPTWQVGRPDFIDVCEVSTGFPSWQIAELDTPKAVLDQHWSQVEAVEGTRKLSLPSHEVLVSVDDADAYAVLQAAIAYCRDHAGGAARGSRTPRQWLRKYENAEEYPAASRAELVSQLLACAHESQSRLDAFLNDIPIRRRRELEYLVEEHGPPAGAVEAQTAGKQQPRRP